MFAVIATGSPKPAHAASTLQVCNRGNAAVYAVVAYDRRPLLDVMGIGKSIVEGWYKINPRGCRDIWKNQATHKVYVNVGFLQRDADGNAGAVIFTPKTGRKMGNSWFCVDPVNGFRYTAKNMSAHTGTCPKGRKGFKFSFSAGLENLRQTVIVRPTKNAVLIPFRGETLSGRKRGGNRAAAVPTNTNTPICRSIRHVLGDAGNAFEKFLGKPFKSNKPNRKEGNYQSTYSLAGFGSCSIEWRGYAGSFICSARKVFKDSRRFQQKQDAIADRIAQCTGVRPKRSSGFGGVQYEYKPANGLKIVLGRDYRKLKMFLHLKVYDAASYRKNAKIGTTSGGQENPGNTVANPPKGTTKRQDTPRRPAASPAKKQAGKIVKTRGIKQCGKTFYYVDTQILRKNAKKGCQNQRYGAVFGLSLIHI